MCLFIYFTIDTYLMLTNWTWVQELVSSSHESVGPSTVKM